MLQTQPRKHVADRADFTAHTDHTHHTRPGIYMSIFLQISRSSNGDDL